MDSHLASGTRSFSLDATAVDETRLARTDIASVLIRSKTPISQLPIASVYEKVGLEAVSATLSSNKDSFTDICQYCNLR